MSPNSKFLITATDVTLKEICSKEVISTYYQDLAKTKTKMYVSHISKTNKKLSYPQRKYASNVAVLYSADGISI